MELFDPMTGCLTDEGLQALTAGGLDELARLEAAEHLAFCDRCLDRYTALLADPAALTPAPETLHRSVLAGLRMRMLRVFANRYATAAAAVAIALCLWSGGLFQGLVPGAEARYADPAVRMAQYEENLARRESIDSAFRTAGDALTGLADRFSEGLSNAVTRPFHNDPAGQTPGETQYKE